VTLRPFRLLLPIALGSPLAGALPHRRAVLEHAAVPGRLRVRGRRADGPADPLRGVV